MAEQANNPYTLNIQRDIDSKKPQHWIPYLIVMGSVAGLTVILRMIGLSFDLVNIALLYLFPVLLSAIRWGIGPSFFAAGAGVLCFDFFFVPPIFSFSVWDLRYLISFVVYLSVATLTASLASRLRQQLHQVREREEITSVLYALSREITAITELDPALQNISRHIAATIGTQVAIFLPAAGDALALNAVSGGSDKDSYPGDLTIAEWVFCRGEIAGKGTKTLRDSPELYVPLRTEDQVHGVLVIHFEDTSGPILQEQWRLVEALAGLTAMAIARIKLQEEAKNAQLTAESERLRTALLDSISHELRTPVAEIMGAVTSLMEGESVFNQDAKQELLTTIRDGTLRMNRLISNLLGMVRLESGMLRLRKQWCDVEDIIGVALAQVKDSLQYREIHVVLEQGLPLISVDDVLIEQVIVNVLSNAVKYSPNDGQIELLVTRNKDFIYIAVKDVGIGISREECDRVFDKFYRSTSARHIPGTGLGLAICKGIIELHGGTIYAEPNVPKGTVITISLPLFEPPTFMDMPTAKEADKGEFQVRGQNFDHR